MERRPFLILPLATVAAAVAGLAQKPKPEPEVALIVGTVFRDPGFALPDARIVLEPNPEGKPSFKVKKMESRSDRRGEFAFRVPGKPMRYNLKFQADGFLPETKQVTISGPERQDIYATLKPVKGGA